MGKHPSRRSKDAHGYTKRRIAFRELRQNFLIVCEGEKTEPNYFRGFRVPGDVIRVKIVGLGQNTINLVQKTIELRAKNKYDQVWSVLDRDSFKAKDFNAALALAQKHHIRVAYSNEAFELWYLLHFNYYDTAVSRKDYCEKLGELLDQPYKKNRDDMYSILLSKQDDAIRNAKNLLEQYDKPNPESNNPSTTVHLLVEQLNRFVT